MLGEPVYCWSMKRTVARIITWAGRSRRGGGGEVNYPGNAFEHDFINAPQLIETIYHTHASTAVWFRTTKTCSGGKNQKPVITLNAVVIWTLERHSFRPRGTVGCINSRGRWQERKFECLPGLSTRCCRLVLRYGISRQAVAAGNDGRYREVHHLMYMPDGAIVQCFIALWPRCSMFIQCLTIFTLTRWVDNELIVHNYLYYIGRKRYNIHICHFEEKADLLFLWFIIWCYFYF